MALPKGKRFFLRYNVSDADSGLPDGKRSEKLILPYPYLYLSRLSFRITF